jgi:hypothetical protein
LATLTDLCHQKRAMPQAFLFIAIPSSHQFSGQVRFLPYAWWWCGRSLCVSVHDHQVRPRLCILPAATSVKPLFGVALITPTSSTHAFTFVRTATAC